MSWFLIVFLVFIAFLDWRTFCQQDEGLCRATFKFRPVFFFFWGIIGLIIVINGGDVGGNLSTFITACVLPVYLFYRRRFIRTMQSRNAAYGTDGNNKDVLLSDLYGAVLVGYVGIFVISLGAAALTEVFDFQDSAMVELMISNVTSFGWILVLCRKIFQKYTPESFLDVVRFGLFDRSIVQVFVLPLIVGIIFAVISSWVIFARKVQPDTPLSELVDSTQSSFWMLIFFIVAVFIAPLAEELIFRGYLFQTLRKARGVITAVFVTAVSFAILHVGQYWGDWAAIGMVALVGLALTLLRVWTDTTLASAVMHYVYNIGVSIIPVIMMYFTNPAYFEYQMTFETQSAERQIELLQASLRVDPDLADAYNDLAWIYTENDRNLEEALQLVDKALSFAPDSEQYLDTKATVLEKLGRMEEASVIRQQLLESEYSVEVQPEVVEEN